MADTTTTSTPSTEVAVSDVASHYAAVIASADAHVALINSKPVLYPGGLPAVLDNMARQTSFLTARVQAAAPVVTPPAAS